MEHRKMVWLILFKNNNNLERKLLVYLIFMTNSIILVFQSSLTELVFIEE